MRRRDSYKKENEVNDSVGHSESFWMENILAIKKSNQAKTKGFDYRSVISEAAANVTNQQVEEVYFDLYSLCRFISSFSLFSNQISESNFRDKEQTRQRSYRSNSQSSKKCEQEAKTFTSHNNQLQTRRCRPVPQCVSHQGFERDHACRKEDYFAKVGGEDDCWNGKGKVFKNAGSQRYLNDTFEIHWP